MFGIYIHIPFCLRKCNYCGFVSFPNPNADVIENYVELLIKEIELYAKTHYQVHRQRKVINSIFFGGGTPSLLSITQIERIIDKLRTIGNFTESIEITIEANPATNIDFAGLKRIGINRISLGVQSFNEKELSFLDRLHSAELAESAIKQAKQHFDNINVDIIYSIPNQTLSTLEKTLKKVIGLGIQHISAYCLTYEASTPLYIARSNNKFTPYSDEMDYEMYMKICETLSMNEIYQYEVSNFAASGFECIHNLNYWKRGNYQGFGLSAHSLIDSVRYNNYSDITKYAEYLNNTCFPVESKEHLTQKQITEEQIFLGLRSTGITMNLIHSSKLNFMEECVHSSFGRLHDSKFILTATGKFITDEIVLKLLN